MTTLSPRASLEVVQKIRRMLRGYMDAELLAMDTDAKVGLGAAFDEALAVLSTLVDQAAAWETLHRALAQPAEEVPAWPKWLQDECLVVLRNMDTELSATGRVSNRIQQLINVVSGMKPAEAVEGELVLLPRTPTDAMNEAAMLAQDGSIGGYEFDRWISAWNAAIAVAPTDAAQGAVADDVVSRAAAAYLDNGLGGWYCSHSAMRDAIAATGLAGKPYEALDELYRALAIIGPVGKIDGYDVIRRDSVIEVSRQRRDTHPQAAPAQGDGWKLVPERATAKMAEAWRDAQPKGFGTGYRISAGYAAMIAAAPSPEPRS